jgi:AcrR family transcriptional regulator
MLDFPARHPAHGRARTRTRARRSRRDDVIAVDGRTLRSVRSQNAIVDAFLSLVARGEQPSSAEIAAKAGVTQRTLFNQFPDVGALVSAAVDRQVAHFEELLPEPTDIDSYVDGLAKIYDGVAAVRWSVLTHLEGRPELARGLRRVRTIARARLAKLVDDIDAAEVATDPITWKLLREQQGLSRRAAADVMRRMLQSLKAGPKSTRPVSVGS